MKIQEEAAELAESLVNNSNIMEEMADLTEVIKQVQKELFISAIEIDQIRYQKNIKNGAFTEGWVLEGIEDGE